MVDLRPLVQEWNRRVAFEAVVEGVIALFYCAFTFGMVFGAAFLVGANLLFGWEMGEAAGFAAAVTAVFVGAGFWSAAREEAPLFRVRDDDRSFLHRRLGLAALGAASILAAGPASLLIAWRAWKRRLPSSPADLLAAGSLLEGNFDGIAAEAIEDRTSFEILEPLGLIILKKEPDGRRWVRLTAKGREVRGREG